MSVNILKALESVREFMHVINNHEATEDSKDYFEQHFCVPVCRQGKGDSPRDPRLVTKANDCEGCFFGHISADAVNRDMDKIIQVVQLTDLLEDE
ncbi:hypothetical protein HYP06_gp054 [Vibrio phage vB_VspP_pVa5]|uniref:Uncharacterized protein n=1 Tax=Vibrio phage vB_VspP_pVa5 TaxID=1913109 RepID=A0A1J0GV72_9CAUD|nr:hypothetical protein HYP06_gp054 [Vibrio phage vB_VspP_pVa5]APC46076.1 hypothetical protein vBVspPpVa5_0054 [Vibrio phage vB_VspP_pVa5]